MPNKQELDDLKHLKQFINLYNKCKDVSKLKFNNEEKEIFSLKHTGASIRFGSSKKLLDYIPEREGLYDFWTNNPYFWIIPMEIKPNRVYGFTLRGYNKSYNVFRLTSDLPVLFGLYDFNNFNLGKDPIILTEGIKDALVLKTIYPYTIALNTAGLTINCIRLIKSFTNRFILIYDNDKAGIEAIKRDKEKLREEGCRAIDVKLRLKDPGQYIKHPNELSILNSTIKQYT